METLSNHKYAIITHNAVDMPMDSRNTFEVDDYKVVSSPFGDHDVPDSITFVYDGYNITLPFNSVNAIIEMPHGSESKA